MTSDTQPSPLEEIEQRVQTRAKETALDLSGDQGDEVLRQLINDEIRNWNEDYRIGARPHPLNDPDLVAGRALRNLIGYGPLAPLLGMEVREVEVSSDGVARREWCRGESHGDRADRSQHVNQLEFGHAVEIKYCDNRLPSSPPSPCTGSLMTGFER